MIKPSITVLYRNLDWALSLLPGVKPRIARNLFDNWLLELIRKEHDCPGDEEVSSFFISVGNDIKVKLSDLDEVMGGSDGPLKVSPRGVKFLVSLYEAKILPMSVKKTKPVDPKLLEYAESEEELKSRFEKMVELSNTKESKRRHLIKNLGLIKEEDYTYDLLNDVFLHYIGLTAQPHTLRIGPYDVTKSLTKYKSNSGKSHDWEVCFSYENENREEKTITKNSAYAGNRRNDADRNWGLHE